MANFKAKLVAMKNKVVAHVKEHWVEDLLGLATLGTTCYVAARVTKRGDTLDVNFPDGYYLARTEDGNDAAEEVAGPQAEELVDEFDEEEIE